MEKIFDTKTPFERFGLMLDCSRSGVMSVEATKRMIDLMEGMDYNMLMLYTEDTYEVEGQPYFGHLRGRYKKEELKELDAYAKAHSVDWSTVTAVELSFENVELTDNGTVLMQDRKIAVGNLWFDVR